MPVVFPHANNYSLPDTHFRSAWVQLRRLFPGELPLHRLPRLPSREPKYELEENNRQLSLEYLCRILVPPGYQDVNQATRVFMELNAHLLRPTAASVVNRVTGQLVEGAEIIGELPDDVPRFIADRFIPDFD
jgi:hypothetical protein